MTIINLERALRKGRTPVELGATLIEEGAQKAAYLYTTTKGRKVVIKANTGGWRNASKKNPPNLRKYDCFTIYHTIAGEWVIQEYVTPLRMRNTGEIRVPKNHPAWNTYHRLIRQVQGDYHPANFGIDQDGKLKCFDW